MQFTENIGPKNTAIKPCKAVTKWMNNHVTKFATDGTQHAFK